jgi:hypothetical protein
VNGTAILTLIINFGYEVIMLRQQHIGAMEPEDDQIPHRDKLPP